MTRSEATVVAEQISLDLPLFANEVGDPRENGSKFVGGRLTKLMGSHRAIRALDRVSFELHHGERVGIVGRNGAGKSTLLRVLAGIYQPNSGNLLINGRISTLFTNRLGLNERATGRENIMLSGHLLGMTSEQIRRATPEIIEFSELGDFIDLPLRTYSAGMAVRLGFAVATSLEADILLIDEVFGAGDREFQAKAQGRVTRLIENAGTLVMASHSIALLKRFCTRILWLDHGEVVAFGPASTILEAYETTSPKEGVR